MLFHLGYMEFWEWCSHGHDHFTMAFIKSNLVIPFNTLQLVIYKTFFHTSYPPLIMPKIWERPELSDFKEAI